MCCNYGNYNSYSKFERLKVSVYLIFLECILLILFGCFAVYTAIADGSDIHNSILPLYGGFNHKTYNDISQAYSIFQDIHTMIFIGFGFLMVFLKKYSYSAIGFNFLLAALILQWSILCQGFFQLNNDYKIEIGLLNLYQADIATATVLISFGAVLGRTSYFQLIVMGILEIFAYSFNRYLNTRYFKAVDAGGSILIHTFGAYFGLAVSYILGRSHKISEVKNTNDNNKLQESSYISNLLSIIGTIFLWIYWPSFNSIDLEKDKAYRAVINTYLALTASCVITYATSQLTSKDYKLNMVHIQNSTLAGGVAIGAVANLMVQPFGAILIGIIAGGISVFGYVKLSPLFEKRIKLQDTCGIHNLHGLPGILGGLISIILALIADENQYGKTLYEIYTSRASSEIPEISEFIHFQTGDGRSASEQAGYQAVLLLVTIFWSIFTGLITGLIMNIKIFGNLNTEEFYDDEVLWQLPFTTSELETLHTFPWTLQGRIYKSKYASSKESI